jgi:hypothetical protein
MIDISAKSKLLPCFSIVCLTLTGIATAKPVSMEELANQWTFHGEGSRAFQNRMFYMEESEESQGVMVVSPKPVAGDVTVRYELMPMTAASVCVLILSATDTGEATTLSLPDGYDGSMGHWINHIDNYFFAFHNMAHDRTPFGIRFPSKLSIGEFEKNVMRNGEFSTIEIKKMGGTLTLSINGEHLFEGNDPNPLGSGHIAFRIRGIPQHPASCLIRNLTIEEG